MTLSPRFPLHNGQHRPFAGTRRQRGFTLVELMVAIALGLLLLSALIAVFLNVSRTNTEMQKANGLIENGRFAIDILQEDIAHAGFWGGYVPNFDDRSNRAVPNDAPSLVPDPCLPFASWGLLGYKDALIGIPIQTYTVTTPVGTPTLPVCASKVISPLAGTDVVVVRHAETCLPGVGNCEADNAAKVYFQASFCDSETLATPAQRYLLSNEPDPPLPSPGIFTLKKRGCTGTPPAVTVGTPADKRKFVSNIYYIRNYAANVGDGIPTLMRSSFNLVSGIPEHEPAVALIEGIQGLVLELGVDAKTRCGTAPVAGKSHDADYSSAVLFISPFSCVNDSVDPTNNLLAVNRGDGVPESYQRCGIAGCALNDLTEVVSVKVYVLARSHEETLGHKDYNKGKTYVMGGTTLGPFEDGFKRQVFQTTVRLVNVSGRREAP
jgi:type IV pilus assembly protein PilW